MCCLAKSRNTAYYYYKVIAFHYITHCWSVSTVDGLHFLFYSTVDISDFIPVEIKSGEKYIAIIIENTGKPIKPGVYIVGGEASGSNTVIVHLFVKVMELNDAKFRNCQVEAALNELLDAFRVRSEAKEIDQLDK